MASQHSCVKEGSREPEMPIFKLEGEYVLPKVEFTVHIAGVGLCE